MKTPIAILSGVISLIALFGFAVFYLPLDQMALADEKQQEQKSARVPEQTRMVGPLALTRSGRCLTLSYRVETRVHRIRLLCLDSRMRPSR